jgi:NADP-dependent 3-hydroxy acid dehydrogenase YdfG
VSAFAGQVAVVTGATSGVGRAVGLALAEERATVCLVGRDPARLESVAGEATERAGTAVPHRADLARDEDVRRLADTVRRELGRLDVLVHAAAVIELDPLASAALADLDRQYRTNARAPYALTQALLPVLSERQGQVVFINSTVGLSAVAGASQYAATKHALRAIADSLRAEVNPYGVRVLSVFLGRTATPMQATVHEIEGRPYRPELLVQPRDVATMVTCALGLPRTAEVTDISMRPLRTPQRGGAGRLRTA